MGTRRVAVTGMGVVSALGMDVTTAFERLHEPRNCVETLVELAEYKGLNSHLAAPSRFVPPATYTRKVVRTMGEVAQMALFATEQAIAQAQLSEELLQNGRCGVAYGSCSGSVMPMLDFHSMVVTKEVRNITSGTYLKLMPQTTAVNLSVHFKTHGRLIPSGTACTSGSLALGYAYEAIKYGMQDVMLAGGAEEFSPTQIAVFDTLYATSLRNESPTTAPSPYDKDRDGLVIGDGAGTFVLEEWEHAKARGATILAELVGFGTNTDGTHVTNPNPATMGGALTLALADANLSPDAIDYVNGHGTATRTGDTAETQATRAVFNRAVPISSIKSYIGHTLGACGAIEAAMTVKSLAAGWFPPTLNLKTRDPECGDLDYIMGTGREMAGAEFAMTNNFAFGGVNTSLIFKRV